MWHTGDFFFWAMANMKIQQFYFFNGTQRSHKISNDTKGIGS